MTKTGRGGSHMLVVDDEPSICWGLSRVGQSLGFEVSSTSTAEEALALAAQRSPDLIVLDVRLPGMDGLSAMERLQECCGAVPIVVVTAYGDLDTAVQAVRNGAFEYLVKPFDLAQVERVIERAMVAGTEDVPFEPAAAMRGMVGRSPAMQNVFKRIALAAGADTNVLISGESGTGKELAARAIHDYSSRAGGPFVAVNVAALNPALAESELFGHVKGSFTGADTDRGGLMAQANGGTLFLDEVADISLPIQVKLLRALEQGEVLPVGSSLVENVDFRVISATHQDLPAAVARGTFRHDLYFRLAAFRIEMPALRERPEDIPDLARHLANHRPTGSNAPRLSSETLDELARRPWFGNVRELRNAIEHAIVMSRGSVINPEHLPPPASRDWLTPAADTSSLDELRSAVRRWALAHWGQASGGGLYQRLLQVVEPPLFDVALENCRDECAAAARILGLHRTTLANKLHDYGLRAARAGREPVV